MEGTGAVFGLGVVGLHGEVKGVKGAVGARGAIPHGHFSIQRVWDGDGTRYAAPDGPGIGLGMSMTRGRRGGALCRCF